MEVTVCVSISFCGCLDGVGFFRRLLGEPASDFFLELLMTTSGGDGGLGVSNGRLDAAFGVVISDF